MDYTFRAVDVHKDRLKVPLLIRDCFHPWMDPDNWKYLNSLVRSGEKVLHDPFWSWVTSSSLVLEGVVCETSEGEVIGHAGSFPADHEGSPGTLIGNVCVLPPYRGQGIARKMLMYLLGESRRKGKKNAYLQVRNTKNGPYPMYLKYGFRAVAERISWIAPKSLARSSTAVTGVEMKIPRPSEQTQVWQLFAQYYPDSVIWNQPFPGSLMSAGWISWGIHSLSRKGFFYRAELYGRTIGWIVKLSCKSFYDRLWWLPLDRTDEFGTISALSALRERETGKCPLLLETDAAWSESVMREAGFYLNEKVVWMRKELKMNGGDHGIE